MPLVHVDLIEGRDPEQVRSLLDTTHGALVEAFDIPPRDRYQVASIHPAQEIVAWDTGLGIERSDQLVIMHIVSRRRTRQHAACREAPEGVWSRPHRPDRFDHRERQ
jgi:4-oxalocrotonate tautomerase